MVNENLTQSLPFPMVKVLIDTINLQLRDGVVISVSAQFIISSEAGNLLILNAYDFKIPRPFVCRL